MNYRIEWKVKKFTKLVNSVNQLIEIMKEQKIDLITFTFEFDNELTMYCIYAFPLYEEFKVSYYDR